jgi:hypothetical protein
VLSAFEGHQGGGVPRGDTAVLSDGVSLVGRLRRLSGRVGDRAG